MSWPRQKLPKSDRRHSAAVFVSFQYSLEGHQFAVFGFVLTNDLRYMVSISTRFVTWDLSTSDLQRDVNPGIEGIMQQLNLSPDNKWAAAYSNNNQTVLLNMLSSEFVIIDNPFNEGEYVTGVFLLNQWFRILYLIVKKFIVRDISILAHHENPLKYSFSHPVYM